MDRPGASLIEALGTIAPGRPLRDGLDRILQANKGALILVGDGPDVLSICSGGLLLDAEFSPQRLAELAKMDGAIILASDASRIARANVHLVPSPNVPTQETGTRHRTAERVARSIDVPVIAVSEDMSVITMYRNEDKHVLESVARLLSRANQALSTLERYRDRLDSVTTALTASEVEDLVTLRDVVTVLQRAEMVRRIAEEIEGYVVELGTDGRLVLLQLEELMAGVEDERRLVVRDYRPDDDHAGAGEVVAALASLPTDRLLDASTVAALLLDADGSTDLESGMQPRGYRLLLRVPRIGEPTIAAIVARFGSLQKVMRSEVDELQAIPGVDAAAARTIKDGLNRLAESTIFDRYS
ncbi:MAG TPA: DNA integrity scanning diadenylate cyclase DisA [Acidimicrobiales bacterium]|nr:DNA integrity scanning diadenylate cyclase DisA [Acidimicrobiales bacterium]